IAFFASLILPFVADNYLTRKKILYWFVVILVFIGGLLTARSFLIAILLGILMLSVINSKSVVGFILSNLKAILLIIPIALLLYVVLGSIFAPEQFDKLFNYAFELFVNFFKGDGFESSSTNRLKEMYILPDNLITWLIGDGKMQSLTGGYYMHTDVGYIRLIFY